MGYKMGLSDEFNFKGCIIHIQKSPNFNANLTVHKINLESKVTKPTLVILINLILNACNTIYFQNIIHVARNC